MKTLLLLLISGLWSLPSGAQRPNLVFILADDLGWADTTLYGHTELYETPHLERLAKRGMTFTRAYAASPLCSPTRASILTGLSPARLGLTTPNCHTGPVVLKATPGKKGAPGKKAVQPNPVSRLDTKYETLAERLKAEGYATGHFGKRHLGRPPHSPLEHGFTVDIPHWPGPGPAGSFVAPWKYPDFDPQTPKEHIEDRMAEEAVAWIEKHRDDLGETTNLAATKPEKVEELDALISGFLDDTAAVLPVPNPALYRPELEGVKRVRQPKPTTAKPEDDPFDPALKGWKARQSTAAVTDGILTLTGTGADPFLGTGATGMTGPATVTLRLRTATGGLGRVSWANGTPKRDELAFPLGKGERWKEVEIRLPAADQLSILRLHFPPRQTVEIDWIKVTDGTRTLESDF